MANISRYSGSLISEIIDGEHVDVSPEHTPADWMTDSIQMVKVGSSIIVGYLCHDSYCSNPLEDSDGMGEIHHHPDSRYGRGESNYYESLGLDRYGEPDLDLVPDRYIEGAYCAYFVSQFADGDLSILERNWDRLEDEPTDEYVLRCAELDFAETDSSGYAANCVFPETYDELRLAEWNRMRGAGEVGDRDAVLLDLYEHSGVAYSVSGRGMQCRWDTSRGAAVWVPDKYAREEIDRRAPVYAFGRIEDFQLRGPEKLRYHAIPDGANSLGTFATWGEAFAWLKQRTSDQAPTPEMLARGRRRAAEELAAQACETYTAWANGDCYGYIVEKHELAEDGSTTFVEELDSCWGFIGDEWAEQALEDQFNYFANESTKQQEAA